MVVLVALGLSLVGVGLSQAAAADAMDQRKAAGKEAFEKGALFLRAGRDHEGRIVRRVKGWSSANAAEVLGEARRAVRRARKEAGGAGAG